MSKGKYKKALEIYLDLERFEPDDGTWGQRAGEVSRRLGKPTDAVAALRRAAETYARQGFLLKAIAVCKVILEIDPRQTDVETRLASLHAARGMPTRPVTLSRQVVQPPVMETGAPLADVSLGKVVPGARLSQEILDNSAEMPIPIDEITLDEEPVAPGSEEAARAALARTPLFSALDESALRSLIGRVTLRRLLEDEVLFKRGDFADCLYVVAQGEVAVLASDEHKELTRLGEGHFFGEIALLADQARANTIRATCPTELLAIDRATVSALVNQEPRVLKVLLRFVRDRLLDNLVRTSPLFLPFADADRRDLAAHFDFLEVEPNAVLLKEGVLAPAMFIVMCGRVRVIRGGKKVLADLGEGEIFGALSLLTQTPVVAEVRAVTKLFLLHLPRSLFHQVILTHPQVLEHINTIAEGRRKQLERWLSDSEATV